MRVSCIVTGWVDSYLHYESRRDSLSSVQFSSNKLERLASPHCREGFVMGEQDG